MTRAIILDCETTGGDDPEPIEIAHCVVNSPVSTHSEIFCQRYKPTKPIQFGAIIYRIYGKMMRDTIREAHSASVDVILTGMLLKAMNLGDTDWESVWQFSERARIPKVWPFGKHRNESIASSPIEKLNVTVGQRLFMEGSLTDGHHEIHEVNVVRVGRKFIFVVYASYPNSREFKFHSDGRYVSEYSNSLRLCLSREEILERNKRNTLWASVRDYTYGIYTAPASLTTQEIEIDTDESR